MSDDIVIEGRNLTKLYRMGEVDVPALHGVDIVLHESEFVVLLGASGSGKSTLLNILGGLDVPTTGTVIYRGSELQASDEDALTEFRREHVGFVFQFYNLIPSLTARENVALVTEIAPDPLSPEEALALVDLGPRRDHFPSQLSGGEQQRVALARAFGPAPKLILADEPTGNLDGSTGRQVIDLLFAAQARHGTTLVLITHDTELARQCQRTVRLADGRIVSESAGDEVGAARGEPRAIRG